MTKNLPFGDFRRNRKGNLFDSIVIVVILSIFAFSVLMGVFLIGEINSAFQATDIPDQAKTITQYADSQLPWVWDFWFGLFFIGLPLVSMGLAFFNDINPVFFWVSLGLVLIVVLLGAAAANIWNNVMSSSATLDLVADRLPITNFIMSSYGLYAFVIFIIIAAGSFVKMRGASEGVYS